MGFKVLLRCGPGELENALLEVFEDSSLELIRPEALDWSDELALKAYCESESPCAVVNSGCGSTDMEADYKALQCLVRVCADLSTPLIHFSSYRVFGRVLDEDEVTEELQPAPKDEYGKHLLSLEDLCSALPSHLILRLSWVLGGKQENVLDTFVSSVLSRGTAFASDHDFARPISIPSLANIIYAVVQQILYGADNWGVFHLHGSDKCSEAEFCDALVAVMQESSSYSAEMPSVTELGDERRLLAGNALLAGDRITRNFGIQCVSWRRGLRALLENYMESRQAQSDVHSE